MFQERAFILQGDLFEMGCFRRNPPLSFPPGETAEGVCGGNRVRVCVFVSVWSPGIMKNTHHRHWTSTSIKADRT